MYSSGCRMTPRCSTRMTQVAQVKSAMFQPRHKACKSHLIIVHYGFSEPCAHASPNPNPICGSGAVAKDLVAKASVWLEPQCWQVAEDLNLKSKSSWNGNGQSCQSFSPNSTSLDLEEKQRTAVSSRANPSSRTWRDSGHISKPWVVRADSRLLQRQNSACPVLSLGSGRLLSLVGDGGCSVI